VNSRLDETRAFFGPRAAGWDERFPDDREAFEAAIGELHLAPGATVLDAGCGTGRALPLLRAAVGAAGTVMGIDPTAEMIAVAKTRGGHGRPALGDATALPLRGGALDGTLASGLLPHLPDIGAALEELARATRPGGGLAVFHPISRAALAARHHRVPAQSSPLGEPRDRDANVTRLTADDPLDPANLVPLLERSGWVVDLVDDGGRYLVTARRRLSSAPRSMDRLGREQLLWLTTVDAHGRPQSSPVWFVWLDGALTILSEPGAGKVANIDANAAVSMHLDGPDVVTMEGVARRTEELADDVRAAYTAKYADGFPRLGTDAVGYLSQFSTVIRVVPTRVRLYATV
jgi:PPOX class probable F420-dependent enzyme